jgi:superfamily I DNA/RNA helicase
VTLEENYRSTKRILAAAHAVISGNTHRHPKKLRTSNGVGAPIDVYEHADEQTEAVVLAREIVTRKLGMKMRWSDLAVLYRTNPQARPIEEALRGRGITYRVVGGTSFFDRKEVADCIAYLRAIASPSDELALRRIINHPPRGIGRTTVLRVGDLARSRGIGFEAALAASADPGTTQGNAIQAFLDLLAQERAGLEEAERAARQPPRNHGQPPIAEWADALFRRLRLEEYVRSDRRNARYADARADNIRDVAGTIARCERKTWSEAGVDGATDADGEDWAPPTLVDALARLALSEMDEEDEEEYSDSVTLMTMHSAKGLEFTDVFIVGLEDGMLPHARVLVDAEEAAGPADPIAEERRLLYVAMTRARERLVLSRCASRRRAGQAVPAQPSRYLREIPEELLNPKTAEVIRTPEESVELRRNFMDQMKAMLAPDT